MPDDSFFANRPKKQQSLVGVPSGSLPRTPVSFSFSNVSLQIVIRSPHPRLGKFVFSDPKRVLQHYPPNNGHVTTASACLKSANMRLMHRSKQLVYSITSSAWASSVGGTVRPSAFAVLRFMTSS